MLGGGPRCKVLGDNSFSAYRSDATTGNVLDTIIIIMKRKKEKTTGVGTPETHIYANR